ncbi:membrane anchor subunit of succinate dehydrogenase, Sdh4 [Gnomoniopsis smithogilvyi]|uniref:Succinate dehydrogenase [ubiquinone] cytochrome b small subunit n=1 Tax=Gnomoniopsis smithogilvyi TaxID=1191159 RepID=A0A9W8Z5P7_9PEZI|nr:membrane anchor subunit of succinate dehydrogenase, Sdh4 [Gnomoniopsis smithogilvyi]
MASAVRSSLLRQTAALAAPASRSMAPSTRAGPSLLSSAARKQLLRPTFTPSITQITAFHATSRRNLLPPGPQVIQGTVNDPAPVPSPSPSHGHYHWAFERVIAAALVPLSIAPFAGGSLNPTLDAIFAGSLLVHAHVSVQAIIIDYVPTWGYPKLRKFCIWALNAATVLAGIGLYEFETTDVGIVEATKRIWKA